MPQIQISPALVTLTVNGGVNGYITVADNTPIFPNAKGWLTDSTKSQYCIVTDLIGTTQIGLRFISSTGAANNNYGKNDCSSYLTGSTFNQELQPCEVEEPIALKDGSTGGLGTSGSGGLPANSTVITKDNTGSPASNIPLSGLSGPGLLYFASDGTPSKATGTQVLSVAMAGTSTRIDVVGAAVQNIDFTGLSGNTDGDYQIEYYLVGGAGSATIALQPENDPGNLVINGFFIRNDGSGGANPDSTETVLYIGDASRISHGKLTLRSKAGQGSRLFTNENLQEPQVLQYYMGLWTDSITVLSKLRIHCAIAGGIGVGSWFVLHKLLNL